MVQHVFICKIADNRVFYCHFAGKERKAYALKIMKKNISHFTCQL